MTKTDYTFLNKLNEIERVNAPNHIKENVFNKIKNLTNDTVPFKWKVTFYAAATIILAFNLFTIKNKITSNNSNTETILVSKSTISNHLYYE